MKKLFLTILVTGLFASVAMADGGDSTKAKKKVKLKDLKAKTNNTLNVPNLKPETTDGGGVPNTKLTVNEEGVPANDKKQKSGTTGTTGKKEEGPK
ncbi:MAG: hypothetical protein ACOZCO_16215 [Bacteroidota bacterium]